jgi:hypothetical protein
LGAVLKDKGDFAAAEALYEQAAAHGAARHEVLNNIGELLRATGKWKLAEAAFRESIRIAPSVPLVHWNLSLLLLLTGRWKEGFAEHEWRLRLGDVDRFPMPAWDGANLAGRSILLHAEQGFGDAIQFVRYIPLLVAQGARIIVQCQPQLVRLFQTLRGVSEILPSPQRPAHADMHAPLMSLPHLLGTTPETVPPTVPYLGADPADVELWKQRVSAPPAIRKVGLVYAGNPRHTNDCNRSIAPRLLAPLGDVPNVGWFSLQVHSGAPLSQLGFEITDLSPALGDFADTAAGISALDLLISVDTAAAHLAGALGVPVWLLLPEVPDWRWLLDRSDSVWYPSMRLFRQPAAGDWNSVVADVRRALLE